MPDQSKALSGLFLLCLGLSVAAQAGTWVPVGQGDCPGPLVGVSSGVEPDNHHCTAASAGNTALCYSRTCNPACEYIGVSTRDCRGGTELADVYTCVAEPPAARP